MFKRGGARNLIRFNLISTTQSNIVISSTNASRLLVDWGDSNFVTIDSGALNSKTFSTPFSGTVSVSMMRGSTKFHMSTYGSMVSNGNIRTILNQNVDYDTFKQITSLKYLYFNDYSGATPSTVITGTFSNICNDLTKLKELHLTSGNPLSDYTISINDLKNLNSLWLDSIKRPITGNITNLAINNPDIKSIIIGTNLPHPLTGSIDSFSQSTLRNFIVEGSVGSNTITGNIGLLPSTLGTFSISGLNTTTGSIANLPTSLKYYRNYGNNTTTGDIGSLPSSLTQFLNQGDNITYGNIANLKPSLLVYQNWGSNTTTGDIGLLPASMSYYYNRGLNTTTGNIASMSTTITTYYNYGYNTTHGNISLLPSSLTQYYNSGSNSTTGDIGLLPTGIRNYLNLGYNTTTGSIANLPSSLIYYNSGGYNTTTGNIANLPSSLGYYASTGYNKTTGDIGLLPSSLFYYYNWGSNTTYGNIASFSSNLTQFFNVGSNSITGDLANLKSTMVTFYCESDYQSTYGNLYNLPSDINLYYNYGCMTSSFTASGGPTKSWNNLNIFRHLPKNGYGLTSSEVDQLLISLNTGTWSGSGKALNLTGNNGPRTIDSDTAVLGLSAKGVQVRVNGRFGAN